jgi:hypothetical protein
MSNGDPVRAGSLTIESNTATLIGTVGAYNGPFFRVGEIASIVGQVDGIHGIGASQPRSLSGGAGVVGFGAVARGTGVLGIGGNIAGVGVFGISGDMHSVGDEQHSPLIPSQPGVVGWGRSVDKDLNSPGVVGFSDGNDGVAGFSKVPWRSGVYGWNSETKAVAFGVYGRTNSLQGIGVAGSNDSDTTITGAGVSGRSNNIGIWGVAPTAGYFEGNVTITGDQTVLGAKHAAIAFGDGTLRCLYSMESPESWFEDFAEGTLIRGKATIKLAADFMRCIGRGTFHVFLTPLGDCNGLYVRRRMTGGFEVRELNGGTRTLKFSYRVVAKRKDVKGERLKKVTLPATPAVAKLSKKDVANIAADAEKLRAQLTTISSQHLKTARVAAKAQTAKRRKRTRG